MAADTWFDGLVAIVPAKPRVLGALARLPPALRSHVTYRVSAALSRRTSGQPATWMTNLGIRSDLRFEIPTAHPVALFGTPELYDGERGPLELAARLSHHADAFIDIGAHVGYFTCYVATRGRRNLPIAFVEPDADLFRALERNVRVNNLGPIRGFNVAIAATDGERTFYVDRSDNLSGSLTEMFADRQHDVIRTTVPARSFRTLADELGYRNACVKVDIEGAEHEFLEGARQATDRIAYLIMEVLGPAHQAGFVARVIKETGWFAYYINDYVLEPSVDGTFTYREPQYNWLFCRRPPDLLAADLAGSRMRVDVRSARART